MRGLAAPSKVLIATLLGRGALRGAHRKRDRHVRVRRSHCLSLGDRSEKLSDRQLQVLADYLVKKAEEEEIKAKRQIEAGTRVIDIQSTEVEST